VQTTKDQTSQQKQSTSIMAFGGGGDGSQTSDKTKSDTQTKNSSFLGFDGGMIDNTEIQPTASQPIIATKINNDLKYTLLQGKIVDAVLETAINTQMSAGIIRAIISRDIYGEQGALVLIPKGSRVVGGYTVTSSTSSGTTQTGQVVTRVYAVWKRIITPSGVDISLPDMPAADPLGRSGIPGYVDTNLSNNLVNAFLVSVLGPYLTTVASGASNQSTTSTTNNSTNTSVGTQTTTTGTVGAQVLQDGLQQFQTVAQDQINAVYPPGITTTFVDQGTKIDIIIQQDIAFPKQSIQLNNNNLP
jgi:type IV secretion system protein VirB10